ncbi:hypothetical protein B0T22DRAFT_178103 [Podospora appendiculata]|uniref:Uncharacterized protein n=1 Tax=Podospora appendiculata TaxID=314037 RepID=A0AAE0XBU1_9PEZI|nr:hypothetical protein B0T22DRAFT_178103 [Podospora appendiculata]
MRPNIRAHRRSFPFPLAVADGKTLMLLLWLLNPRQNHTRPRTRISQPGITGDGMEAKNQDRWRGQGRASHEMDCTASASPPTTTTTRAARPARFHATTYVEGELGPISYLDCQRGFIFSRLRGNTPALLPAIMAPTASGMHRDYHHTGALHS